jgi:hypothetical protein
MYYAYDASRPALKVKELVSLFAPTSVHVVKLHPDAVNGTVQLAQRGAIGAILIGRDLCNTHNSIS